MSTVRTPWSRNTRRMAVLFVCVLVAPALALIGLGVRVIRQESASAGQRAAERREAAADRAVLALEQGIADLERTLAAGSVPDRAVRFVLDKSGIAPVPPGEIAWNPAPRRLAEAGGAEFAAGETHEFRGDAARALEAYEPLRAAPDLRTRVGALLRLARIHRNQGEAAKALDEYAELAKLGQIAIEGMPADLLALRARCEMLRELGRHQSLLESATDLAHALAGGRWSLDASAYEMVRAELAGWGAAWDGPTARQRLYSEAASALWSDWRSGRLAAGRSVRRASGATLTLLAREDSGRFAVLALGPEALGRVVVAAEQAAQTPVALLGQYGELVHGPARSHGPATSRRSAGETRLPWTVVVTSSVSASPPGSARLSLLGVGLSALLLLLTAGGFFLWRLMQRELAVARFQAGFVSAVSHEFRTPLTTLRHVTELLNEDDELPAERRKSFYASLARNTERLHRLVESLLDFSRMEAGRRPYDLQTVPAHHFVRRVVEEFRAEVYPKGFDVQFEELGEPMSIRADTAALGQALWNLLDNAVKYSPAPGTVEVRLMSREDGCHIAVTDHGIGIPRSERSAVFDRFFRGEEVQRLGIQGTGIGLALASHIVAAHGGRLSVISETGQGSTFTIALPRKDPAWHES